MTDSNTLVRLVIGAVASDESHFLVPVSVCSVALLSLPSRSGGHLSVSNDTASILALTNEEQRIHGIQVFHLKGSSTFYLNRHCRRHTLPGMPVISGGRGKRIKAQPRHSSQEKAGNN